MANFDNQTEIDYEQQDLTELEQRVLGGMEELDAMWGEHANIEEADIFFPIIDDYFEILDKKSPEKIVVSNTQNLEGEISVPLTEEEIKLIKAGKVIQITPNRPSKVVKNLYNKDQIDKPESNININKGMKLGLTAYLMLTILTGAMSDNVQNAYRQHEFTQIPAEFIDDISKLEDTPYMLNLGNFIDGLFDNRPEDVSFDKVDDYIFNDRQTQFRIQESHRMLLEYQRQGKLTGVNVPETVEAVEDQRYIWDLMRAINIQVNMSGGVIDQRLDVAESNRDYYAREAFAEIFGVVQAYIAAGLGMLGAIWNPSLRRQNRSKSVTTQGNIVSTGKKHYIDIDTGDEISEAEWETRENTARNRLKTITQDDFDIKVQHFADVVGMSYQEILKMHIES